MSLRRALAGLFGLALLSAPLGGTGAQGALPERRAIAIASRRGKAGEAPLRWSERDAQSVLQVLRELGQVEEARSRLLVDPAPADVLAAVAALSGDRAQASDTNGPFVLYYSGHADRQALHLGEAELRYDALRAALRETGASVRVLVVDACESGGVTEKGVAVLPALPIVVRAVEDVRGEVLITSSAADEASLESERLQGSFFTHHLVAGLRGAARGADQRVTLAEAYSHAYAMTVAATGRTRSGPQHPSFSWDVHGAGELVLTELWPVESSEVAHLTVPAGSLPLLLEDEASGALVAELGVRPEREQVLALSPGRYRVALRGEAGLQEGLLSVDGGQSVRLDDLRLRAVPYLALARKGAAGQRATAHQISLGGSLEAPGVEGVGGLTGARLGYRVDRGLLWAAALGGVARADSVGDGLVFEQRELDLGLGGGLGWSLGRVGLQAGLLLRGLRIEQRFAEPERRAGLREGARTAWVPGYGLRLGAELAVSRALLVQLGLSGDLVRLPLEGRSAEHRLRLGLSLGLAWSFPRAPWRP